MKIITISVVLLFCSLVAFGCGSSGGAAEREEYCSTITTLLTDSTAAIESDKPASNDMPSFTKYFASVVKNSQQLSNDLHSIAPPTEFVTIHNDLITAVDNGIPIMQSVRRALEKNDQASASRLAPRATAVEQAMGAVIEELQTECP